MKQWKWFLLLPGFVLGTLLDACRFSVQVLPPAAAAPTSTFALPAETVIPRTPILPTPTPTLIPISIDLISWLEVFKTFEEGQELHSLAFSPDGALIASAAGSGEDATIRIREVASGDAIRLLEGHTDTVWDVAFSPDGQTLASVSSDKTARVWNWQTGDRWETLDFPGEVVNVSFSPDGRVLAVGGVDESRNQIQHASIWTFDTDTWALLRKFPEYLSMGAMAYSPDGSTLIGGGTSRNVQVWSPSDGDLRYTLNHAHQVTYAAIAPDNVTAATATCAAAVNTECTEGAVWLWNLSTGRLIKKLAGFSSPVEAVEFSPDGSFLIAAEHDGNLQAFATSNYELWFQATSPGGATAMAFSPDGRLLATGGTSGQIQLWRVVYRP